MDRDTGLTRHSFTYGTVLGLSYGTSRQDLDRDYYALAVEKPEDYKLSEKFITETVFTDGPADIDIINAINIDRIKSENEQPVHSADTPAVLAYNEKWVLVLARRMLSKMHVLLICRDPDFNRLNPRLAFSDREFHEAALGEVQKAVGLLYKCYTWREDAGLGGLKVPPTDQFERCVQWAPFHHYLTIQLFSPDRAGKDMTSLEQHLSLSPEICIPVENAGIGEHPATEITQLKEHMAADDGMVPKSGYSLGDNVGSIPWIKSYFEAPGLESQQLVCLTCGSQFHFSQHASYGAHLHQEWVKLKRNS